MWGGSGRGFCGAEPKPGWVVVVVVAAVTLRDTQQWETAQQWISEARMRSFMRL